MRIIISLLAIMAVVGLLGCGEQSTGGVAYGPQAVGLGAAPPESEAVVGATETGFSAAPAGDELGRPAPSGGLAVGAAAPNVPFTTASGRSVMLNSVRQPIAIVGFVNTPGADCNQLAPQLRSLSQRYLSQPVTVVQMSVPAEPGVYGPGCQVVSGDPALGLVVICDPSREALASFNNPAPGTIYLLDNQGVVIARGTLDRPGTVTDAADKMAADLENMYRVIN